MGDISEIQSYLYYDGEGGIRWTVDRRGTAKAGCLAGAYHHAGYRVVRFMRKLYKAQDLAWVLHYGDWPEGPIGFKDKDPLNLRPENLYVRRIRE